MPLQHPIALHWAVQAIAIADYYWSAPATTHVTSSTRQRSRGPPGPNNQPCSSDSLNGYWRIETPADYDTLIIRPPASAFVFCRLARRYRKRLAIGPTGSDAFCPLFSLQTLRTAECQPDPIITPSLADCAYPVIALGGFHRGVCSSSFDRQQGMASWIAVIMLVSWLWLMLENSFTQLFTKVFKREIPEPLLRYATQMIHQESLFFVLPFFFVTTAWNSGQSIFTGLLGAAALVSIIDPLYYKWLAPKRSLFLALHTLTLFAALLTALPIIMHLTTAESYKLALGVAMALSIPSLAVSLPLRSIKGWAMCWG